MDDISVIDPIATAEAGSSVPYEGYAYGSENPGDFSSLFSSLFGLSGTPFDSESMNNLMNQYMTMIRENTDYNNAWSSAQAERMMDFQRSEREWAQMFNQGEAAKNRNWQEYMSSTAHQREVADLKAAGLNPVLSARGGNGAAVTSGATAAASVPGHGAQGNNDQSANSAIAGILGTAFSAMTNMANKMVDAQTSLAVAQRYTEMERIVQEMKQEYGKWEHENYPSNPYEVISAVLHLISGKDDFGDLGNGNSKKPHVNHSHYDIEPTKYGRGYTPMLYSPVGAYMDVFGDYDVSPAAALQGALSGFLSYRKK